MDQIDAESNGLFDTEEEIDVPDDLEIQVIEDYHSWKNDIDEYKEAVDEYRQEVQTAIQEKDTIYDIKINVSKGESGALRETWIFYAE